MNQTLNSFVLRWNKTHENLAFSYDETPVTKRPTNIGVRFSPDKYECAYSYNGFSNLNNLVYEKSHDTMCIATDRNLLRRGIIEILVASENPDYREEYIVGTLKSLGKELLSHVKAQANAG